MTMDAETFFDTWVAFIGDDRGRPEPIMKLWDSTGAWTVNTIGKGHSMDSESPFGDYLNLHAGDKPWNYYKEERGFDLVLSGSRTFSAVEQLELKRKGWKDFYPVTYDVVVEQEAAAGESWVENDEVDPDPCALEGADHLYVECDPRGVDHEE